MKTKIFFIFVLFLLITPSIISADVKTIITIHEKPDPILFITNYSETSPKTISHFLNYLEPCPYGGACGMRARYINMEAQKVNLSLYETTIIDWDKERIKKTLCSGHRVNIFEYQGQKYYTTNLYNGDNRIVNYEKLMRMLNNIF